MPAPSLPYVCIRIGLEQVCALLDSGSSVSLVDYQWYMEFRHSSRFTKPLPVDQRCRLANGQVLPLIGRIRGSVVIDRFSWPVRFVLAKNLSTQIILGCDFMQQTGLILDYSSGTFHFKFSPDTIIGFCSCRRPLALNHIAIEQEQVRMDHLRPEEADLLRKLLDRYPDLFSERLGVTSLLQYKILLSDDIPVRHAPYRLSPPKMNILRSKIDQMLRDGVIRPSTSPYASPVFLVPKGQGGDYRVVVDYRSLNKKVILESVPLPDLHNCFTWFSGAEYFTVLDLNQAYFQIPLAEGSKAVTAFCTDWNLYEFNRVPFGLATGAAVLSRLLDAVLGDLKFKCVYNYLDDLVIYSGSFQEHLLHLDRVFSRLRGAGLTVKPSKIDICKRCISFLGHMVSADGIRIDQERTRALRDFPPPRDKKGIARFIGMANFFRKFIPDFAHLAAPLNNLRKKKVLFRWGREQQQAFENLKSAIVNPPVLAVPNFNSKFIVQTDASRGGIAAVLLQEEGGERRPVAYASRRLNEAELRYSVYECEALAVLFALEKFAFYLEHQEFLLETDNQALSWVLAKPRKTGRIARWAVRISAFRFQVKHIRGADNAVADALSRMFAEDAAGDEGARDGTPQFVNHILVDTPELFCDLESRQGQDPEWAPIRSRIEAGEKVPGFVINKGLLCKQVGAKSELKVCVPGELVPMVLRYYHDAVVGGHLGVYKTFHRVQEALFWPRMYRDVRRFVTSCQLCKRAKPDTGRQKGLLQSERERYPLDRWFIDYIGPLPRTQRGNRYILVIVDAFSRFSWLLPTSGVTANITIKQLTNVIQWFGPPKSVVSDNAPAFLSKVFKDFCFKQGIRHITTTAYYPKASFAERVNRNLKAALCIYHAKKPTRWDTTIPWLNQAFNTARHEVTGVSPSSLMFSYTVNHPLSNLWSLNDLLPSEITSATLRENWDRAHHNIRISHRRQADRYNQGRRPFQGKIGDMVYIRNFTGRTGQEGEGKMRPRFRGPCRIIKILGPVNLEVRELSSKKKFRVHVSQVKMGEQKENFPHSRPSGGGQA